MEGARGDEQNVIGLHRAVLGGDRGAFDERKQIALHALARDIAAATPLSRANLVDLVEKHDPIVFDLADRLLNDLILIDHFVAFLDDQGGVGVLDRGEPRFWAIAERLAENIAYRNRADRRA